MAQAGPRRPPAGWRRDVAQALGPGAAAGAEWLGDLNAERPWCTLIGDLRLAGGGRVVAKYHTDTGEWARERAVAEFLAGEGAPPVAPALLGADPSSRLLVFERVDGGDLGAVLDAARGPTALDALVAAADALGRFHRWSAGRERRWLEAWPGDAEPELLPGYDRPDEELMRPFLRAGAGPAPLLAAVARVRRTLASPGDWLGFCHGDLQVRHVLVPRDGVRFIDWERAGLRHRLYDLACLLTKPQAVGRRIPPAARRAAVAAYCRAAGLRPRDAAADLLAIMAYEYLIHVAENSEIDPEWAADAVADLAAIRMPGAGWERGAAAGRADPARPGLEAVRAAAVLLRPVVGRQRLPVYRGLGGPSAGRGCGQATDGTGAAPAGP